MALVRVYCGLTATDQDATPPGSETWLTVAVVDDAGRLLDICDISDDAPGFSELGALLAERSNGLESVAIAADSDEHIVTRLLTAAGRYLAYTDEDSAEDYAARFSNDAAADEMQSSPAERRAIGLARALQAGVLSAVAQPTPRDLFGIKPVLAAHAAVTNGRQSAAATLREVLRELYPAALRAFPDPAEPIPLAILDALPEPGPLGGGGNGRGRDAQAIAELAEAGVADQETLAEAVSALREAIAETPRRTGMNRSITNAVAETVRQSVAAVRACDAGAAALVSVLSARMPAAGAAGSAQPIQTRGRMAATAGAEPAATTQQSSADEPGRAATGRRTRTSPARPRSASPTPAQPQPQPAVASKTTPPTATPAVPPAAAGVHRSAAAEPVAADQPAPRTRAARRAAEKRAEEQVAAAAQAPTPVQSPAATPVPVTVASPPPVPVQSPPAPIPVPPPATVPTPVNPAPKVQPEPTVVRSPQVQPEPTIVRSPQVPPVPPPGLTPAFPTRSASTTPFRAAPSEPAANFTVAPGPVPTGPVLDEPAVAARSAAAPTEPPLRERRPSDRPRRADAPSGELPRIDFTRSLDLPAAEPPLADRGEQREGRVVPPWQSIDLPAEPPALRLVEPAPLTDPALSQERSQYRSELGEDSRLEPRPLRLVEDASGAGSTAGSVPNGAGPDREERASRRAGSRARTDEPSEPPAKDEADGDLLIFAEARSAWFTDYFGEDDTPHTFDSPSDEGWRAARHAAEPTVGAETPSGLPRRVPQQNLVPGSPVELPERPLRVVRDPAAIAAHTSGYFRGWRRGQEVGGYRVGGRPGRESAGGWDFSRDQQSDDERGYEYRSARR
ncbi:transposase [Planosporangium thailandense]|uniref:transposase n=1 Tax=Planosporangium thailandense TaxID=765197 RepID=UPI003B838F8B